MLKEDTIEIFCKLMFDSGILAKADEDNFLMFLANILYESCYLTKTSENLSYNEVRLKEVFPKHFKECSNISDYCHNPKKLGDLVYGNRLGNAADEGFKYKGRGYIQLTGKRNYTKFDKYLHSTFYQETYIFQNMSLVDNPELVEDSVELCTLTCIYFYKYKQLFTVQDFNHIVKTINGGLNGLSIRKEIYNTLKENLD